ncbi:MAG TPA: response regulator transcription factor [Baekduia sp.]|nr:response regulator transcription factor [Baekduia sp.]
MSAQPTPDDLETPERPHLTDVSALVEVVDGRVGVRVLVVEDHEIVQWGLRSLLGRQSWVQRCVPARRADDAIELAHRYDPHVALVDVCVSGSSGMDVCRSLRELPHPPQVLLMSAAGAVSMTTAKSVGAVGVIPKNWTLSKIGKAVQMIANGIPLEPQSHVVGLSNREREVLGLVATGATNNQIAAKLFLSPHTVKDHVSSIFRKLKVRNRAEAVQRGQSLGLTA